MRLLQPTRHQNRHTLDTTFTEDDRPWIEADANGMLAVLLLRRIAYTILALFRSTTLRSAELGRCAGRPRWPGCATRSSRQAPKHTMNLRVREVRAAVF